MKKQLTAQEKRDMAAIGRTGEHTLEEIGTMFGVTRERARQILVASDVEIRRGGARRNTRFLKRFPPETHKEIRAYAAEHGVTAAMRHFHTSAVALHDLIGVPRVGIRKVTDAELRTMRAAGLSASTIARQLDMAPNTINERLRRMGLNSGKGNKGGMGGQPMHRAGRGDEVRRLRAEGLSYNKIASRLDVSIGTVQYHLGKKPPRPRAPA